MSPYKPDQTAIRAVFMRGGASKGIVFHADDLPQDQSLWDPIFLAAMGSPDPNQRQLDGMGGGQPAVSKVCIVGKSAHPDADIDYRFGQVEIRAARVDYQGSCGSMASAIGPFAVDEGLVEAPADGEAAVRIRDVNASKIIVSRFVMRGGKAAVTGDLEVDGITGSGSPVKLEFLSPGGAATGRLLPFADAVSTIDVDGFGRVDFSFVDASNPLMFVEAATVGLRGTEMPEEIEANPGLLALIETIRRHVTVAAGAAPSLAAAAGVSLPRIAFVSAPADYDTLSGRHLSAGDTDILIRMIGRGRPHRAVPVTTALCLAVACRLPGSIPYRLLGERAKAGSTIVVGHPSGAWRLTAEVSREADGWRAEMASLETTQRRLFQGELLVPSRYLGPRQT